MTEMIRVPCLLLSLLTFVGCSASPPLNRWVENRGYHLHRDYSSIDTLGWEVDGFGNLSANPMLKVIDPQKGDLPDMSESKNRRFRIEGKVATQQFLKTVANLEASDDFDNAYSAEIQLSKPFKYEASDLLLKSPCSKKEMIVATRVLNTGEMMLSIYDEHKNNITGKLVVKQGEANVTLQGSDKDKRLEIGKNLYVGYFPQRYNCVTIAQNEDFTIKKGQHSHFGGVDFMYLQYRTDKDDAGIILPIAETYIAPSGYFMDHANTTAIFQATMELASLLADQAIDAQLKPIDEHLAILAARNVAIHGNLQDLGQVMMGYAGSDEQNTLTNPGILPDSSNMFSREEGLFGQSNDFFGRGGFMDRYIAPNQRQTRFDITYRLLGTSDKQLQLQYAEIAQLRHLAKAQLATKANKKSTITDKSESHVLTNAKRYPLSNLLQLAIPGKRQNSAVYLEVKDINEETVRLRIQHLVLERRN